MHNVYPPGWMSPLPPVWVPGPVEYELLWDQLFGSINGDAGGTWAPGAFITIGAAGLQLAGIGHELMASSGRFTVQEGAEIRLADTASVVALPTIRVAGSSGAIRLYVEAHASHLDVESGAILQIDNGGFGNVYGALTLISSGPGTFTAQSGTTSTWNSGATATHALGSTTNHNGVVNLNSGGAVSCKSGSTFGGSTGAFAQWAGEWWFAGTAKFVSGTWPLLDPVRTWTRYASTIALTSYNNHASSGPASADLWVALSDSAAAPCFQTASATNSGDYSLIEFHDLPAGASLTRVEVDTKGGSGTVPVYPTYRIVRWRTGDATLDNVSALTTDDHSVSGNWNTDVATTTLTPSAAHTIDNTYRYGLRVDHPYAALSSFMRIYRIAMLGSSTSIQV
jgi:hypothetical protein